MKEGILFGIVLGMFAGAMVYRYSQDVQKIADKGEKIMKQEVQKIKKANTPSINKQD